MINAYIGITDKNWFELLRSKTDIDEVNFWKPGGQTGFKTLRPGELFLFKLHAPDNYIVGGGIFAHFSIVPISIAWEAFQEKNGAETYEEMRRRVEHYRRASESRYEDYRIGCILLEQPFFFEREDWIPAPADFSPNIVQGKTYDLSKEPGLSLWKEVQLRRYASLSQPEIPTENPQESLFTDHGPPITVQESPTTGQPTLITPRLGQGAFRIVVTDGYERRCAFSGERTLPALEAAHIKPFSIVKEHRPDNGLLLRKDIHALFDRGYITVTPDRHIEVSKRIKEEFENGRDYYQYHCEEMREPRDSYMIPDPSVLEWHNENRFLG